MASNKDIGRKGEELARIYLESKAYVILELNWRFSKAEIDIIAKDKEVLVFVEVKTRSYNYYGEPEDFISENKVSVLTDAAAVYANSIGHEWEIRFDIISIITKGEYHELKHFKDVFFEGWQ